MSQPSINSSSGQARPGPAPLSTEPVKRSLQILSLEDNPHDAEFLRRRLSNEGLNFQFTQVETRPDFTQALDQQKYDLILSDYTIPAFSGREALLLAREKCPEVPFIFFSGTIGDERAVECLKIGAADFVLKDNPSRLGAAIRRAIEETEQRHRLAETSRALQVAEVRFRTLVEQSIVGVYVIQDGCWTYVNPKIEAILGYLAEEMVGRPVANFIAPKDRSLVQQNINKRLTGAVASLRYQLQMMHKSGALLDVEVHGSYTEYNGHPGIMGVMLDITERKRTEGQIREQATLLDKALNAIMLRDLSGVIRYWNEGAQRLYGWSSQEAIGQLADTLLFRKEFPGAYEAPRQAVEQGEWNGEFKHTTKAGVEVIIESHWTLICDDSGEPKSILVVNHDVTEKRKIDAQVRRTQRMDSIGALAGGIAHDLNNVLSPILMALTLLKEQNQTESGQKLLDILDTSCRRGAEMVKQILLFARGAEGERRVIRLQQLLGDLVKVLKQMFPKTIKVEIRSPNDLWAVMGDTTQLHQVFMNLCVNARDAMPNGGLIRIEASNTMLDELAVRMYGEGSAGSYVLITVSDTGTGIPPEIMEKIFEPFFTTKEVGKGTGLGLSTVLGIIKGQGGFVKVYSENGRGTSFRVYLPAVDSAETQRPVQFIEVPQGHGENILLVDDEMAIREITKAALEQNGYVVYAAADGAEAVALYAQRQNEINVVITDMTMPVMDGSSTIRVLQRINPEVKVIAVSGLMVDLKSAQVEETRNVQFLAKPFDIEKLLITLNQMLTGKPPAS